MKKEILFRGENNGDWIYGDLIYSVNENQHYIVERTEDALSFPVDEDSLGEFTERFDNQGTKIFAGDLVVYKNKHVGEVRYKDGKYILTSVELLIDLYDCYDNELAVVGNIIDNKI